MIVIIIIIIIIIIMCFLKFAKLNEYNFPSFVGGKLLESSWQLNISIYKVVAILLFSLLCYISMAI